MSSQVGLGSEAPAPGGRCVVEPLSGQVVGAADPLQLRDACQAFARKHLGACAREILDWQQSCTLKIDGGRVRELAAMCARWAGPKDSLEIARSMVVHEALQAAAQVCETSTPPDKSDVAVGHLSMIGSRWVLDVTHGAQPLCFCPLGEDGEVYLGLSVISDECPGVFEGIVHADGQDAAERWVADHGEFLDRLKTASAPCAAENEVQAADG